MQIRHAKADEATSIADVWLAARKAAGPRIPPPAHSEDETRGWFRDVVVPSRNLWVIGPEQQPEAMMLLSGDCIEQLYVAPARQGHGHGSRLIRFAQSRRSELHLWTFEANLDARRFHEKHGFSPTGPPSSDNEEGAPAVLYRWSARRGRPGSTASRRGCTY